MKKYYILYQDQSGLNGIPIFLNARLWENIDESEDLMKPYSRYYEWDKFEYKKEKFPSKLYFIVKAPKISFDYYPFRSGLIVSHFFLDLIVNFTNDISIVPLEVYSNKRKIITNKKYYFLKFNSYLSNGIDYKKSIYIPNVADNGEIMMIDNHPWIASVEKLVLNDSSINNFEMFCLHGWIFFNKPIISENLLNIALKKNLYGIKYIETNNIVNFYNNKEYLKKGPLIIE